VNVVLTLTDDQLDAIAERVAAKVGQTTSRPLTVAQAADQLGVCSRTILRRIQAGEIARVPVSAAGSRYLIPASEITRLLTP